MTSHSGDSFTGDVELPAPSTPMRCHTALGICSSSSSLSQEDISGGSVESLNNNATAISVAPRTFLSAEGGIVSHSMDENRNSLTYFETVHEGELLEANEKHGKGKNISGFLKKLTSSKRKKASKATSTGTL